MGEDQDRARPLRRAEAEKTGKQEKKAKSTDDLPSKYYQGTWYYITPAALNNKKEGKMIFFFMIFSPFISLSVSFLFFSPPISFQSQCAKINSL